MRVLFVHQGQSDPGTPGRVYPWMRKLAADGVTCHETPNVAWRYPAAAGGRWRGRLRGYAGVAWTVADVLRGARYDLVFAQRLLFPHRLAALDGVLRAPRRLMVDIPDAVFCAPDDDRPLYAPRLRRVCEMADSLVVSNQFMADWIAMPEKTVVIPTCVDCDEVPSRRYPEDGKVVIGWTGLANQLPYLRPMFPGLRDLVKRHGVEIIFHTSTIEQTPELTEIGIRVIPFDPRREVEVWHTIDIGLMPVPDTVFSLGKCPAKLIRYMAAGSAVVCSPVGSNREIVEDGVQGYYAEAPEEWHDRLERLIEDRAARVAMGMAARRRVEERYSVASNWPRFREAVARAVGAGA